MTKAEAFVYNSPKWRATRHGDKLHAPTGKLLWCNTYEHQDGLHMLDCYSTYGDSFLYRRDSFVGNVEASYDTALAELV